MANNDDIEKIKFNPKVLVSGFLFSITAKVSNKMLIHKDNTKPSIPVAERKVTLSSMPNTNHNLQTPNDQLCWSMPITT